MSTASVCVLLCACSEVADAPQGLDAHPRQVLDGALWRAAPQCRILCGSWGHLRFLVVLSFVPGGAYTWITDLFSEYSSVFFLIDLWFEEEKKESHSIFSRNTMIKQMAALTEKNECSLASQDRLRTARRNSVQAKLFPGWVLIFESPAPWTPVIPLLLQVHLGGFPYLDPSWFLIPVCLCYELNYTSPSSCWRSNPDYPKMWLFLEIEVVANIIR